MVRVAKTTFSIELPYKGSFQDYTALMSLTMLILNPFVVDWAETLQKYVNTNQVHASKILAPSAQVVVHTRKKLEN